MMMSEYLYQFDFNDSSNLLNQDMYNQDHFDSDVMDFQNSMSGYTGGYQEGIFGKDPLLLSNKYQCPPFAGIHYVDSYVRADGTIVEGHWRSNPDGIKCNNLNP